MGLRISKGQVELEDDGFVVVESCGRGWYVATDKDGDTICFLRQGPQAWHAFYLYKAFGSGTTPRAALLGDLVELVEDDDRLMYDYHSKVQQAPMRLVKRFAGLRQAGAKVMN